MSEDLKKGNVEKSEVKETGKTELEDVWSDIIVGAVTSIPWETADKVATMVEQEINGRIGEYLRRAIKRNVANAIGDTLVEAKKHFMEITEETSQEE